MAEELERDLGIGVLMGVVRKLKRGIRVWGFDGVELVLRARPTRVQPNLVMAKSKWTQTPPSFKCCHRGLRSSMDYYFLGLCI